MFIFVINGPKRKALDVKWSQLWQSYLFQSHFGIKWMQRGTISSGRKKWDDESKSQEPCFWTQGKTHRCCKRPIFTVIPKIIIAVFSTPIFCQFLLIPRPYMHSFSCGETLAHNWCPQLVLLHYFAIKVMFKAFYFSVILYGKSQTVLMISWRECIKPAVMSAIKVTISIYIHWRIWTCPSIFFIVMVNL